MNDKMGDHPNGVDWFQAFQALAESQRQTQDHMGALANALQGMQNVR